MDTNEKTLPFKTVHDKLYDGRSSWYNIGLALNCDNNELSSIQTDPQYRSNDDRLKAMLTHRLQAVHHPLTWTDVCNALMHDTVGRRDIAEKIDPSLKSQDTPLIGRKRTHSEYTDTDDPEPAHMTPPEPKRQASQPASTVNYGPVTINNYYTSTPMATQPSPPPTANVQPTPLLNQPEALNGPHSSTSDKDKKQEQLREKARALFKGVAATFSFAAILEIIKKVGWAATELAFMEKLLLGGVGLAGYLLELFLKEQGYTGAEHWYADKVAGATGAVIQGVMVAWPYGLWAMLMGALLGLGFWLAAHVAGRMIAWLIQKSKEWSNGQQTIHAP